MHKILIILGVLAAMAATGHALVIGPSGVSSTVYAPNAPTLSSVTSSGATSLSLVWSYGTTDGTHSAATSVNVYRGTSAGGESATPVATGVTASPYSDTGLTSQAYYYYLKGVNTAGTSTASNEASGTPSATLYAPNAPTGVSASAGNAQATVSFTASAVDGTHSSATSYTATSSPGSLTATGSASPLTVTGLTNGTGYTFTVTASNGAGTSAASTASASVTPTAGILGLLDFETASLTPTGRTGAYNNENTSRVTLDSTKSHAGAQSMKIVGGAAPQAQLSRQITLPASGTVSFERWFLVDDLTSARGSVIFGLSPDQTVSAWKVGVVIEVGGVSGVAYFQPSTADPVLYAKASMSINTWYRLKVDLNCTNNTVTYTLYDAAGTQLAQAANLTQYGTSANTFSGSTAWLIMGRDGNAGRNFWVDDVTDGI